MDSYHLAGAQGQFSLQFISDLIRNDVTELAIRNHLTELAKATKVNFTFKSYTNKIYNELIMAGYRGQGPNQLCFKIHLRIKYINT